MEQLVEFLLKNWYLVLIGLTFLYQIRKKSSRVKQGNPTRTGMPPFGESRGHATRPSETRKLSEVQESSSQSRSPQGMYGGGDTTTKLNSATPEHKVSRVSSLTSISEDKVSVSAEDAPFTIQPTKDQLIQGIMWAEILGPPRSKKPHRRS